MSLSRVQAAKKHLNGSADTQILAAERMMGLGLHEAAIEKLGIALSATKRYWSKAEDDWIVEPDYHAIIKSSEIILNYCYGTPPQRQEIVQVLAVMDGKGEVSEQGKDSVAALATSLAARIGVKGKKGAEGPGKPAQVNLEVLAVGSSMPAIAADEVD